MLGYNCCVLNIFTKVCLYIESNFFTSQLRAKKESIENVGCLETILANFFFYGDAKAEALEMMHYIAPALDETRLEAIWPLSERYEEMGMRFVLSGFHIKEGQNVLAHKSTNTCLYAARWNSDKVKACLHWLYE